MLKFVIKKIIKGSYSLYYFIIFLLNDYQKIIKSEIIFILPYYQTGGAERVHLNIVNSVSDKNLCILFTHNSATENFKKDFKENANIIEINKVLGKKNQIIIKLLKKKICSALNKSTSLKTIFSSNTNFFYEILPSLNESIVKIDLIHAISNENKILENHYVRSSTTINTRIVINKKAFRDVKNIYDENNVNNKCENKIVIIENGINIDTNEKCDFNNQIKIGFVGRWSKEKRPEIILRISNHFKQTQPNIKFIMAGIGMNSNIHRMNQSGISYLGEITNNEDLSTIYKSLTFLLITSYREGFPVVIMEAMSHGVIPLSTDVGGINEHINNESNGFLIPNYNNEDSIVNQFIDIIEELIKSRNRINEVSLNAFNYSRKHFNLKEFKAKYRNLLLQK